MPRSSTASLVIEEVTIWPPPISTRTCEVVAPFFTSTTVPLIWLRALMRMMVLMGLDWAVRGDATRRGTAALTAQRHAMLAHFEAARIAAWTLLLCIRRGQNLAAG